MESNDPNNDPEFVSLFTITDSDEDTESDEDYSVWKVSLTPAENPYDRAARVQQANRELFSQPYTKKKPTTKVQFDLVPQNLKRENSQDSDMEDMSVNTENNNNHSSRFQRKDSSRVVVLPRRFSSLKESMSSNRPLNTPQPTRVQPHIPRLSRQHTDDTDDKQSNEQLQPARPNQQTQSRRQSPNPKRPSH